MDAKRLHKDLAKLIAEHGSNSVVEQLFALTKPARGRPKILDWNELGDVLEADAIDIIHGKDPTAERKNTAIAKRLAKNKPLQSFDSSVRRIQMKLAENRNLYGKVFAAVMSVSMAPHNRHLEIIDDLIELESTSYWVRWRAKLLECISQYETAFGPPSKCITIAEIMGSISAVGRAQRNGIGLGLQLNLGGEKNSPN